MSNEYDWLEIVDKVNLILDQSKKSAQKIVGYCDKEENHNLIDREFLEILNGLSKIATLTSNAYKINNYSRALSNAIKIAQRDMRNGSYVIKHLMNQLCGTGFDIKKKREKWELKFPKIDINLQKFEGS